MSRVTRKPILAGSGSSLERRHEERVRGGRVAARPQHPATLEREAYVDDRPSGADSFRLVEEVAAAVELAAQPLDACELRQHLRPSSVVGLTVELLREPPLGEIEVVEVPERPEPIHECDPSEPVQRGGLPEEVLRVYGLLDIVSSQVEEVLSSTCRLMNR